jgi:hypothetical protein
MITEREAVGGKGEEERWTINQINLNRDWKGTRTTATANRKRKG